MANKILIIGVGSAGVIAADKMNVPNSKKLFIDSSHQILKEVKSEGKKIGLFSQYINCLDNPDLCRKMIADYEDEIRESIINALKLVSYGYIRFVQEKERGNSRNTKSGSLGRKT